MLLNCSYYCRRSLHHLSFSSHSLYDQKCTNWFCLALQPVLQGFCFLPILSIPTTNICNKFQIGLRIKLFLSILYSSNSTIWLLLPKEYGNAFLYILCIFKCHRKVWSFNIMQYRQGNSDSGKGL